MVKKNLIMNQIEILEKKQAGDITQKRIGYSYILSLYRREITTIQPTQKGIVGFLRVNKEYKKLTTPLSEEEYTALKQSIKENGIRTELQVLSNGDILCGNARYKISEELSIKEKDIPYKIIEIEGEEAIERYIIEDNLCRRQLTPEQKALLELQIYKLHKKVQGKRNDIGHNLPKVDIYQKIATDTGQSRSCVVKHIKYAKYREKHPELKEKRLSRVLSRIKMEENTEKEREKAKDYKPEKSITIYNGDFEKICDKNIKDNSIDIIITDPPYLKQYHYLWDKLGEVAKRVLKPRGLLIAYGWQPFLKEFIDRLSKNLDYFWCISLIHNKGYTKLYKPHNLMLAWKPILIFYKKPFPKREIGIFQDIIEEKKHDKSLDNWQQTENGIRFLVEHFTNVGDLVLDPMCGTGSTLKVCKNMKRKCIGIEINKVLIDVIKGRLTNN